MDSSKQPEMALNFNPPYRAMNHDILGGVQWTVQDAKGLCVTSCGTFDYGRAVASMFTDALNATQPVTPAGMTPCSFDVSIPDDHWQDTGPTRDDTTDQDEGHDPSLRLLASCVINGTPCHIEAYRVAKDDIQRVDGSYFEQEWEGLCKLQDYGAYITTTIRGHEYVLVITPHCD